MAYTAPATKVSGDPTLAADWNNYVRDNFIALRALLPDPSASNLPLVSTSTTGAAFGQLDTGGIKDGAVTADKLAVAARAPIGAIQMYAGLTAPSGWLLCRGQAISRSDYQALFDVIGTNYGSGDGSTTFQVPNLQERFAVGVSTGVGTVYTIGATGGAATANLSHSHGLGGHTHIAAHSHTVDSSGAGILVGDPTTTRTVASGTSTAAGSAHGHTISWTGMPTSTASATAASSSASSDPAGNASQATVPPYVAVNYLIFAGK